MSSQDRGQVAIQKIKQVLVDAQLTAWEIMGILESVKADFMAGEIIKYIKPKDSADE